MLFIAEGAKETVLDFSQENVKVFFFLICFYSFKYVCVAIQFN